MTLTIEAEDARPCSLPPARGSAWGVQRSVMSGDVATICIKLPRTGVLQSLAIAEIAAAAGCTSWVGSQEVQVGAQARTSLLLRKPRRPRRSGDRSAPEGGATLLEEEITVRDGLVVLPEDPGSGVRLNDDALMRFAGDA